jgi:hypothetical protein
MLLRVEEVTHLEEYKLRLKFNNGFIKDVDLEEELFGEMFAPLRDLALFSQVEVNPETNTIEWPNGADFAPEFLFEIGDLVETADLPPELEAA